MFWPCMVYNGLWHTGCATTVSEDGIEIAWLFFNVYKLNYSQIIKIIKHNKKRDTFKAKFNTGTRKNEIFDLQIPFQYKSFIKQIDDLGWIIETREQYEREMSY